MRTGFIITLYTSETLNGSCRFGLIKTTLLTTMFVMMVKTINKIIITIN